MKKKYFYKGIIGAYILAIAAVGYLLYTTHANLESANQETVEVQEVLDRLLLFENLHNKIQSIETGERGFVITGDEDFLDNFYTSLIAIKKDTIALQKVKMSEPGYAFTIDTLQRLIADKITHGSNLVDIKRLYGYDSVRVIISQKNGKILSDKIAACLLTLEKQDLDQLQISNNKRVEVAQAISRKIFLLALIFLLILFFTYYSINKDFKKLLDAEAALTFNASLIRNISDPVITTDIANRIINWNSFAEELYGFKQEEVKGKEIFTVFNSSKNNTMAELFNQTSDKDTWKGEMEHQHKNGSIIYTDLSISSIKNDLENKVGAVYVVRDISKRKAAELQLQALSNNLEKEVAFKVAELNTVFDRITDAFIALDNNWNYTYVNKKAAELHGKPVNKLLGKNIWEVNPDVVNEPFYEALHKAKATSQPLRVELYYSTIDRWFEDLIYPSTNGISVYYHDITERKKVQIELKEAEEKFRTLVEQSMVGVYIVQGSQFIYINPVMAKVAGYTVDEVLNGKSIFNFIYKEDHQMVLEKIRARLDGSSKSMHYEMRGISKNGKVFDVEVYGSVINYKGKPAILGTLIDISDRKKSLTLLEASEKALKISNERFLLVAKATNDAIWDWNMLENTIWGNEVFSGLFNVSMGDIIPLGRLNEKIHPDDIEKLGANIERAIAEKESITTIEFRIYANDGSILIFNNRANIVYNEVGEPVRMLGAMTDITERKKIEDVIKLEKELSDNIINSLPGVFYLFNKEGKFYRWNRNFIEVSGYNNEEILSLHPSDLFNDNEKPIVQNTISNVFTNGEDNLETSLRCKDGTVIPYFFTGRVIRYQGELCLMGVGIDISEKVKSQLQLLQSEQKYRLLFDKNPMPMWMLSIPDRHFLDVNNAAIDFYGYTKEEFLTMSALNIRSESEFEKFQNYRNENYKGVNYAGVWSHKKKDGSIVQMDIVTHDIDYEGANARLVLAMEVTEKIKAELALQKSKEEFRELATHLEKVRETERTHIAREIHDELGQQLTGLKMDISWLNKRIKSEDFAIQTKIAETITLIDTTVKTVRRISTALRPSILDDLGLVAAMEWQSEDFEKRSEIVCHFSSNVVVADVEPDVATGIFRIYQESLTNVLRHSAATKVISFLQFKDDSLVLSITDDGKGFLIKEIGHKKTLGLLGMKERAFLMGGSYEISSSPGNGTSVIIIVPLVKLN